MNTFKRFLLLVLSFLLGTAIPCIFLVNAHQDLATAWSQVQNLQSTLESVNTVKDQALEQANKTLGTVQGLQNQIPGSLGGLGTMIPGAASPMSRPDYWQDARLKMCFAEFKGSRMTWVPCTPEIVQTAKPLPAE